MLTVVIVLLCLWKTTEIICNTLDEIIRVSCLNYYKLIINVVFMCIERNWRYVPRSLIFSTWYQRPQSRCSSRLSVQCWKERKNCSLRLQHFLLYYYHSFDCMVDYVFRRAFCQAAPTVWNDLLFSITSMMSVDRWDIWHNNNVSLTHTKIIN